MEEWETLRERMIRLLSETKTPLSTREIAFELNIEDERLVYEELKHVAKTVKRSGKTLYVQPAYCKKCGFVFKQNLFKKPSRCPRCKSQWIEPPRYLIR